MLRLLRSTRSFAPRSTVWIRNNSSAVGGGSNPPSGTLVEETSIDSELDETMAALDQAIAETFSEEQAEHALPSMAQTEEQLFGGKVSKHLSSQQLQSLGLQRDPSRLPLRRPLDFSKPISEEEYAMTLIHGRSVFAPYFHPKTHDVPVASIHFRSHHVPLLNVFTHFAAHAASSLGIPVSKVVPLPTQRTLWTVPRSPFVHKKSQENFERRVHKRAIKAWDADPEVIQRWIMYLRKHAMAGVGMKVTTWERLPLGLGTPVTFQVESGKESALPAKGNASEAIQNLAKEIVKETTPAKS